MPYSIKHSGKQFHGQIHLRIHCLYLLEIHNTYNILNVIGTFTFKNKLVFFNPVFPKVILPDELFFA